MISYIIESIPSQELRVQAQVQRYRSVDELLTAFANITAPKEAPKRSATVGKGKQSKEQKSKETSPQRCYNCNEGGHIAAKCTKPKRERGSCFKCGKLGHRAAQCDSPAEGIHWLTQEQREDDDCRRAVELQISDRDNTFSINFDALIDSGSPICIVKERYIPRKHVIADSELERFHGINGSGLRVIGCVRATLIFEREKYDVVIRVVPNDTMRTSLLLGRDFMKIAKLSISSDKEVTDKEIADIMNIEIDKDAGTIVQDMRINDDLSFKVERTIY